MKISIPSFSNSFKKYLSTYYMPSIDGAEDTTINKTKYLPLQRLSSSGRRQQINTCQGVINPVEKVKQDKGNTECLGLGSKVAFLNMMV